MGIRIHSCAVHRKMNGKPLSVLLKYKHTNETKRNEEERKQKNKKNNAHTCTRTRTRTRSSTTFIWGLIVRMCALIICMWHIKSYSSLIYLNSHRARIEANKWISPFSTIPNFPFRKVFFFFLPQQRKKAIVFWLDRLIAGLKSFEEYRAMQQSSISINPSTIVVSP